MEPSRPACALVTGGARRIGRVICGALAARGLNVAVHYNTSAEAAEETAHALIKDHGVKAAAVRADLLDETAVRGLIAAAEAAVGPADVLVNNASVFEYDDVLSVTRESWDTHMTANLYAPFALSQAFARALGKGAKGNIINIVDQRVLNPTPFFTSYTLSKMSLHSLTQILARALAPDIRVNAVGPGPVLPSPRQTEAQFESQWRETPLGRPVSPDEIAAAVGFILDAPSMTGQTVIIDSGQHMGWAPGAADAPGE
ncbi:MAG: SDR family oxidoreductase [Rhodospirillales bacterium]